MEISVIVPAYNAEKYIEKCLLSLMNQTMPVKAIVINDGSSDKTQAIVKSVREDYPDRIQLRRIENSGIAAVRNLGLSLVDTPYFGFLDSDDYVDATMYEKLYKKIKENESDLVYCDFFWTYEDGKLVHAKPPFYETGRDMLINSYATLWNKLYRSAFVKETGLRFPDGLRYEDASFLYRLASFDPKIAHVDEPLVYYVQVPTSITHTHNDKVKDMILVFEDLYRFYEDENKLKDYREEIEYLFVKFFLGNSMKRTVQIKDKHDRKSTLDLGWNLLVTSFPNWKQNRILIERKDLKHRYFRCFTKPFYVFMSHVLRVISLLKGGL